MRRHTSAFAILIAAAGAAPFVYARQAAFAQRAPAASTQPAARDADLPVHKVVLFASGVGYYERAGDISGNQHVQLDVTAEQLNDLLKSLVLEDLDGGRAGAVDFPSTDSLDKQLSMFGVNLSDDPPLATLMARLRGSRVTLASNGQTLAGTVLGIEHKQRVIAGSPQQILTQAFLNLITDAGVRSISFDELSSITLDDLNLQNEMNRALAAIASSRDRSRKSVDITFTGVGERRVRVGYVVAAPVWKASYRLVLGETAHQRLATTRPADGATLQGWGIVENQTDADWANVSLSLASGRPTSFTEDLANPIYLQRPTVEPDRMAGLVPQAYSAGIDGEALGVQRAAAPRGNAAFVQGQKDNIVALGDESVMNPSSSVSPAATGAVLGELYTYTVADVSLASHRSAMLPILSQPLLADRVSIFNAAVLPRNPLYGVKLHNATEKTFPAGPVTVLDGGGYAGDAQLGDVPAGQDRLLSYGVDLQLLVDPREAPSETSLVTGKIIKGVLELTQKQIASTTYFAENKSDRDRTLLIEHPRPGADWNLVDTAKPEEVTDSVERFRIVVPAGKSASLPVHEQWLQGQTIALLPADLDTVLLYSRSDRIPPAVRDALAKAATLKSDVVTTKRKIDQGKQAIADVTSEQGRLRNNLEVVGRNTPYGDRVLAKLNDQETAIEKQQNELTDLAKSLASQQATLDDYVQSLSIG